MALRAAPRFFNVMVDGMTPNHRLNEGNLVVEACGMRLIICGGLSVVWEGM